MLLDVMFDTSPSGFTKETFGLSREPHVREPLPTRLGRWTMAIAYGLKLKRIHQVPRLLLLSLEWVVRPAAARRRLANARQVTDRQEIVAVVDDLNIETMIDGYRRGIYPMAHMGFMKWWSPAERAVLDPNETHIDKNSRRTIRQGKWKVTFDRDFGAVVKACAGPRRARAPLTWLTARMMQAFVRLHEAGFAHSVEVWSDSGDLIGGLFGIALGSVFFGQSQFSHERNASKIAVGVLHCHLAHWGFVVRDGQRMTPHLESLGFKPVRRDEFETLIERNVNRPVNAPWIVDPDLDVANWHSQSEKAEAALKSA
ncbi:leucyl/phenylalanyl-tRNA--protein transferase [Flaviflagellibacter deserti]|uniref:Leucyl/phenylalanyl-tRNA--protein transferase n=1 Tax=Flaviflagellibacter deserti TaxID=2267266 RepID=A0ABV9YZK3_9HYPH